MFLQIGLLGNYAWVNQLLLNYAFAFGFICFSFRVCFSTIILFASWRAVQSWRSQLKKSGFIDLLSTKICLWRPQVLRVGPKYSLHEYNLYTLYIVYVHLPYGKWGKFWLDIHTTIRAKSTRNRDTNKRFLCIPFPEAARQCMYIYG